MIINIEIFHINDLFSVNVERGKPIPLLHVSGVMNVLYFLFLFFLKILLPSWQYGKICVSYNI